MAAVRFTVLVTAAALALATGAAAAPAVEGSTASPPTEGLEASLALAKPKTQKAVRKAKWAQRVKSKGTTALLKRRIRTNAGQQVRVRVTVTTWDGSPVNPRVYDIDRGPRGRITVDLTGKEPVLVKMRLRAPAVDGYSRYRENVHYPVYADDPPGPDTLQGAGTDFLVWILKSVGAGALGKIGGWALGALFGGGGDMEEIKDQLKQINAKLDRIAADIERLKSDVAFTACQGQTTAAAVGVATIQTASQVLQNLIVSKETDPATLRNWANTVVGSSQTGSVQWAINQIDLVLSGQGGTTGAIGQCAKALRDRWDQPLGESDYYAKVWKYLDFFRQYQIVALNLMLEANHLLAAQAAKESGGRLPPPKNIAQVCSPKAERDFGPNPRTFCNQALQMANVVYYNLLKQSALAGAGFSWNPAIRQPSVAIQKDTPLLWVTDLNMFGDRSRCSGKVTSDPENGKPCGATFGKHDAGIRGSGGLWYDHWSPASFAKWNGLLPTKSVGGSDGQRLSQYMEQVGFSKDQQDRVIVYTGENVVSLPDGPDEMKWLGSSDRRYLQALLPYDGLNPEGVCFLDSHQLVRKSDRAVAYCNNGGMAFNVLANWFAASGDEYIYNHNSDLLAHGSDRGFYQGHFTGKRSCYEYCDYARAGLRRWADHPGWLRLASGYAEASEYLWPVTDISDDTNYRCQEITIGSAKFTMGKTSGGGAYTMCGQDFAAWLKTWLPDPPPKYPPES